MKKNVKIISVVIIVILMVAYGIYAALQPMPVETETIMHQESEITFTEAGIVVHSGEQTVYPLAAGKVESVLIREGDRVSKGQTMAELNTEVIDQQILQTESTLEGYRAQLAGAEQEHEVSVENLKASRSSLYGQLQSLKAQQGTEDQRALEEMLASQSKDIYEKGLMDLEKNRELLVLGIISESEFTAFEQLVATYEANYLQSQIGSTSGGDAYEGSKNSIYAQISAIDATLDMDTLTTTKAYYESMIKATEAALKGLKSQGGFYNIDAPIDGVVNSVTIENTNMVTGMEPAFIIQGEGDIQIEVNVSTRDIDSVAVGDNVRLELDRRSGDLEITGTVRYIASSAVVEISPLGIEERKVAVYIEPESTDGLGAGYEVDVKFIVFSDGQQLVVPNSAIYQVDGQDTVMVIRGGKAVEVPVTLGYELTGETIIDGGLAEGDQLIRDLDAKGLSPGKNVVSSNE